MVKEGDLRIAHITIYDNIILKRYKQDVVIDYDGALEITNFLNDNLEDGKAYGLVSDIRLIKNLTREARDLYSKAGEFIAYNAILYEINLQKSLASMFLMFSKPERFSSMMFTQEDDAIKWLKSKL